MLLAGSPGRGLDASALTPATVEAPYFVERRAAWRVGALGGVPPKAIQGVPHRWPSPGVGKRSFADTVNPWVQKPRNPARRDVENWRRVSTSTNPQAAVLSTPCCSAIAV